MAELFGDEAAIARWIESDAGGRPDQARLRPNGAPVWAIVGQLKLEYWKPEVVAGEYELSLESVHAAVAYYRRHQQELDHRVAANRAFFQV